MLTELAHFVFHAPATLVRKWRLPQDALYAELIAKADDAGLARRRAELVAGLSGHVVELGCGTGAMFPHYRSVDRVTAIEPDPAFADRARLAARADPRIEVVDGSGERIPLASAAADACVVALVLCSVASVPEVCREIARVVRPGGAVRLIEHVRSPGRLAGMLMDLADPLWLRANGQGCHMNRDPLPALRDAGLDVESSEAFRIWSPGLPAFPFRAIRAVRR